MQSRPRLGEVATLPNYDRPPVVETVLGVEFGPIVGWKAAHFGLFWEVVRAEYPRTETQPPLPSIIETFGSGARYRALEPSLQLLREPSPRCIFADDANGWLVQLQRDRFLHNWNKTGPTSVYPRFPAALLRFEESWKRFSSFLEREGLPLPEVQQCEVTYINHIERGAGWDSLEDLPAVLAVLKTTTSAFLPGPDVLVLTASYVIPDEAGRLHVSLQPALRNADQVEVLQLQLTARGRPKSSAAAELSAWLELGRQWVVKGFTDITTDRMHTMWGRRQ